jgi:hypothetical protein
MRIRNMRAILVLLCMALVLATGVWQASTSMPDLLFSSDIFSGSRAQHSEPLRLNTNFFTTMMGTVPQGESFMDDHSVDAQGMSLQLPMFPSQDSWMSHALSTGVSPDMSSNPAMNSYSQLIARFPNQSNIFGPYDYGT